MNRILTICIISAISLAAAITVETTASAQGMKKEMKEFTATGMTFSGTFITDMERHRINFTNVPGPNVTVCLTHGNKMDYDFSVFKDGRSVCYNTEIAPETCCSFKGKGNIRVHISSVEGKGPYTVRIKSEK